MEQRVPSFLEEVNCKVPFHQKIGGKAKQRIPSFIEEDELYSALSSENRRDFAKHTRTEPEVEMGPCASVMLFIVLACPP